VSEQDIQKRIHDDFRVFLWALWDHLSLPVPTPVQNDIAKYLQHGPRRRIILAFRGLGKSWITVAYVLWRLYRDPQERVLVVSASEDHAIDFSTFLLQLIETWPLVQHLQPPPQRRSKMNFDVGPARPAKAPSVKSVGVFGQLQGPRATLIVADDVETLHNAETPGKRAKLARVTAEFDSIITPGGDIVYLGTPQYEDSLYNRLNSLAGCVGDDDGPRELYSCRIWPALVPDEDEVKGYGSLLAPTIQRLAEQEPERVGFTTDPDRFSDNDLAERKLRYGRSGFRLQFMLDTSLSDEARYPLHLKDLIVMSLDRKVGPDCLAWGPTRENEHKDLVVLGRDRDRYHGPMTLQPAQFQPYDESILVIDPSGRGTDETAWVVAKSLNGQVFITHLDADTGGYTTPIIERMAQAAKEHGCGTVVYESNFGDGMFGTIAEPIFAKVCPVSFREVRHSTQKERRIIQTLEPIMNQHRLIIDRSVVERDRELIRGYSDEQSLFYSLFWQMSRLTDERACLAHDDRLDCLAMAVAYFQDQANQDVAKAAESRRQDEIENWITQWEARHGLVQESGYHDSSGVGGELSTL
jgi:hypothetical protein